MFSIGKLSKVTGVSVQAIRLYQDKGLLKPVYINEESGYRYFDMEGINAVWRVKVLQSAGLSLEEIRQLPKESLSDVLDTFMDKKARLEREIKRLQLVHTYVSQHVNEISDLLNGPDYQIGVYRSLPDRLGEAIIMEGKDDYMKHMERLAAVKTLYGLHQEIEHQPSRQIKIINDKPHLANLLAVYRDVDTSNALTPPPVTSRGLQKGGLYYCKKYSRAVDPATIYQEMIGEVRTAGYSLRGDAIELILLDDSITENPAYQIKEIQIALNEPME